MELVLIVDDNEDLRELFSIVLTRIGYQILTASGGNECISLLTNIQPDLVLLDIMMEPVDGWETLTRIRADQSTLQIPVIMLTGKQPTREELQQHLADIDGYVVKPVTVHELSDLVKKFFQARQRIDKRVQGLRKAGADETLVSEFSRLCRIITACSSFLRIMPELQPDINEILKNTRNRLDTIRHDYKL